MRRFLVLAAILVGAAAGAGMGFLTVTLRTNPHVAGLGLTLGLVGLSEYVNRLFYGSAEGLSRI